MISCLHAREILDSRGRPALEVELSIVDPSIMVTASVPSGASTGIYEALELRDKDPNRYNGMGLKKAIANAERIVFPALKGMDVSNQLAIDQLICKLDGTKNKENLGANTTLAVSWAAAKAGANIKNVPLYRHIQDSFKIPKVKTSLPRPFINIINGGIHADNALEIQEFMIFPAQPIASFKEAIRASAEVMHRLRTLLKAENLNCNVGDEGGFAPEITNPEDALKIIMQAIAEAGYEGFFSLALDVAASQLISEHGKYKIAGDTMDSRQLVEYYQKLLEKFPIMSIEDGLGEDDEEGWRIMTQVLGKRTTLVADDLFTTNKHRLLHGIANNVANAILIKPNQIGTISETMETIKIAQQNGYKVIVSHRSGETEDNSIAHLAVAVGSYGLKSGSLARSERLAKYNEVMRIEDLIHLD